MAKKQEWVEGSVGLSKKELWIKQIAYNLILILVCAAVLYPVVWVVKMALTPNELAGIGGDSANIQYTLDNFRHVIFKQNQAGDYLFFHQLWNSVIVSAITTVIGVLLACTAAYGFARLNFVGRQMGLQAFLVTQMFPGVVMMIPLYIILGKLGLTDNVLGLVLVYSVSALPFCVWNLKGYFDTIPKELEEAAIVDGASRAKIFVTIVLPLARLQLTRTAVTVAISIP